MGGISGAHFNPAITVGLAYAGKVPKKQSAALCGCAVRSATLAAFTQSLAMVGVDLAKVDGPGNTVPNPALPLPIFSALLSEVVGTMILAMTVLAATDKDSSSWRTSAIGVSLAAATPGVLGGIGARR